MIPDVEFFRKGVVGGGDVCNFLFFGILTDLFIPARPAKIFPNVKEV